LEKILTVNVKTFDKEYLKQNSTIIFKSRELIVEIEKPDNVEDEPTYRFKVGDGITPYTLLPYVSSLYALVPNICFYNKDSTSCVKLNFLEGKNV
jgi:hypothetical protein